MRRVMRLIQPRLEVMGTAIVVQTCWGVKDWYYDSRSWGPYACYGKDFESWTMLRAYRSGGIENVYWKYTNDPGNKECMFEWDYYAEDGECHISFVPQRMLVDSNRWRWSGLPVYRSGGVKISSGDGAAA
jgi:hypothetical protein